MKVPLQRCNKLLTHQICKYMWLNSQSTHWARDFMQMISKNMIEKQLPKPAQKVLKSGLFPAKD